MAPPDCALTLLIPDSCELAVPPTAAEILKEFITESYQINAEQKPFREEKNAGKTILDYLHRPANLFGSLLVASESSPKSINELFA